MKKLSSLLIVLALLGVVVYLALGVFSSPEELRQSFSGFEWKLLPLILLFSLLNYIIRFLRWDFYCRKLELKVGRGQNIGIFGAGLVATLTPAKSGELVKSYLLKKKSGTEVSRSAPMILMERMTDFIGLLLLSGVALLISSLWRLPLVANNLYLTGAFAFLILLIVGLIVATILANKNIATRIPLLSGILGWIRHFLVTTRLLFNWRIMTVALGFSIPAWFAEGAGLYFTLRGFDIALPLVTTVFIYSLATIVGTLTFLPGGLGGTEVSMIGLLLFYGIAHPEAVASTMLIRACTLWFAVLVGFSAFAIYNIPKRASLESESSMPMKERRREGETSLADKIP